MITTSRTVLILSKIATTTRYEVSREDPAACVPLEEEEEEEEEDEERCPLPCSHGCGGRGVCQCPQGMTLTADRFTCAAPIRVPVAPRRPVGCAPMPASEGLKLRCSAAVGENYAYPRGTVCRYEIVSVKPAVTTIVTTTVDPIILFG